MAATPDKKATVWEVIFLISVLLLGMLYIYSSFLPRMRFAQPGVIDPVSIWGDRDLFKCHHDRIYLKTSEYDVLFFGSSRTSAAVNTYQIERAYESVSGAFLSVNLFDSPMSNPELSYFFFKDYLANNQAPGVALFELTAIRNRRGRVAYAHPQFPDLAPPYLYLDILKSWSFVRHTVFAVSDFLNMLIRHLDLSLARFFVMDANFAVSKGDNCLPFMEGPSDKLHSFASENSFEVLLNKEMHRLREQVQAKEIGSLQGLFQTYRDHEGVTRFLRRSEEGLSQPNEAHFWRRNESTEYSLDFYSRIVSLGEKYNVKVAFYFLPKLLAPESARDQVRTLTQELGASVYIMDYEPIELSYHYYSDLIHIKPEFTPLYSVWFAGLIDKMKKAH